MKRLFVIDGYGQIYRSYFAFIGRPLTDSDGNNVSAVYGFFSTLMMIVKNYAPDYIAVAMDSKGKTFRHDLFPQYKANRDKTPDDLHTQVSVITDMLDAMHIACIRHDKMEADDIIAALARSASSLSYETVMVTGDKDLLQLVSDSVKALRPPRKGEKEYSLCGPDEVKEIFGVRPDQIVDYLTILGDSSDNVPGIDGIGEKGAVKLLTQYNHIDDIYNSIDALSPSVRTKLQDAQVHIELSKTLIRLNDGCMDFSASDIEKFSLSGIDWNAGVSSFRKIGASSLVSSAQKMSGCNKKYVADSDDILFKTENVISSVDYSSSCCTTCVEIKNKSFTHIEKDNKDFLVGFDLKNRIKSLRMSGVSAKAGFDIGIAAWMLDSDASGYDFDDVCRKHLGFVPDDEDAAIDALYSVLSEKLRKCGLYDIFCSLEMPLVSVLSDMELAGIILDRDSLSKVNDSISSECEEVQNQIYTLCGKTFNLNSPKQLQDVLFTDRKLPVGKKTHTGYSTDNDVLESLASSTDDPVPPLLIRYRVLNKLLSTYISQLPELISSDSGRIHTTFLQTGTATGRLSCRDPNLQNIPVRTNEGRMIRSAFVSAPGCVLLSADYSQIELVVLADMSGDANLCDAFLSGSDVHTSTAAQIFGIFPQIVTPEQRRMAKTVNFGIMYGMSAFSLAKDLKISRKEAQAFIDAYFDKYSTVASFMEGIRRDAIRDGFVTTAMGHIRYIPGLKSQNNAVQSASLRAAVNTVIQGSAAEIMKKAMISVSNALAEERLSSKILLQVHDELILEVPEAEVERVEVLVERCMTGAASLRVPLRVGIETGTDWGMMH